jgi:TonB-linked SusC/RagA family outer membrane protein
MRYKPLGKLCFFLLFSCLFATTALAQRTISGMVQDASDSSGLPGVNITVPGTTAGTVTDAKGHFSLQIPASAQNLTFSFMGYTPQTLAIGSQSTFQVHLQSSSKSLGELVVVGYGTQNRRDVTGTISSIKGADIRNLPVSDAAQAIQGKVPGVDIVRSDGSPGTEPSIRIRGTGTINNAEPLVIIDGVPASGISDVSPNDIASMEILKDASSSAIYGTRAANGVVIITTKRGGYGEKSHATVNVYRGTSAARRYIPLLTAPELVQLKQERYTNAGTTINPFWQDPYYAVQRTDWQKALLGSGSTTNADVNLRGGSAVSNYLFSAGYYDEKGLIENTFFKRYSFRINSEHKLGSRVKVGQNLQLTYRNARGFDTYSSQTGLIFSALRFNPAIPVRNEDGSYGSGKANNELGDINNPVYTAETTDAWSKTYRILASVYGEVQIVDGLSLRVNGGYDGQIFQQYSFTPSIQDQVRTNANAMLWRRSESNGTALGEAFLTYNKTFNNIHQVTLTGGYSVQQTKGDYFRAERWGFSDENPDQRVLDNGATIVNNATGNYNPESAIASGFLRAFYGYKGKYLFTGTFRADGSSRFPKDKRWGYFPAFSMGWRISDEEFFKNNVGFMSNMKLTGGWGQLGNQNVADYQYMALIKKDRKYSFGGNPTTGVWTSNLANPNITWEKAEMTNISLEMGFFRNALNATVTWFNKNTRDMLVPYPVLDVHGTGTIPDQNIGQMNNKGWEIDMNYHGGKTVHYNIGMNASFIKNRVTQLYAGTYISSPTYGRQNQEISRTYAGQPIASFYGWKTNGIYQNQAAIDSDPYLANDNRRSSIKPGDVRFVDVDGDGKVDENDRTYLGSPNPKMTYGISAGVDYKGFDLSANFAGVAGVKLYNADRMQGLDPSYAYNMYAEAMGRWHGEGTSNSMPRMYLENDNANLNARTSDRFLESGDYFSLRNVTLGYTIPARVWGKSGISDIRIYATGQNVFMITKYKGLNPELGYATTTSDGKPSNLMRGVDVATYPQARVFTFGATMNF